MDLSGSQTALQQHVAAIDVGSTKVAVLTARPGREGWQLTGVGLAQSIGVRKGIVVDLVAATEAVAMAVHRAEQMAGGRVTRAWLAVGGNHLGLVQGWAQHSGTLARVDAGLAGQLAHEAQQIHLQSDRRALAWHLHSWTVDGAGGVRDPVGMLAADLAAHGHLVTAGQGAIGNLSGILQEAGIEVAGLLSLPEAMGLLLTPEERQGALALDLGGQTTTAALYQGGALTHLMVLPVGGDHLTNDLAMALNLPLATAEQLKQKQGVAAPGFARDESFTVGFPGGSRTLNQTQVATILESRLREIFTLILHDMRSHGKGLDLPQRVVVTGGGAQLYALPYYLNELLGLPVRVGTPPAWMQKSGIDGPPLSIAAGLLIRATADALPQPRPAAEPSESFWQRLRQALRAVARRK